MNMIERDDFAQLTDDDFSTMWLHAFTYADPYVSTDDAADYADHYVQTIRKSGENDWNFLPGHSGIFQEWLVANQVPMA